MAKYKASIVRFVENGGSVREAIELSNAFEKLKPGSKVFIKPNIIFWTDKTLFPKWGVMTTSRVIEEIVVMLKDSGVNDIIIGEGILSPDPMNKGFPVNAYKNLGYEKLAERYGVKLVNVFERPFASVIMDGNINIKVNSDIMDSDFVINAPVLKTHIQTVVSLGMKNLKGVLNVSSRKQFHSPDEHTPLEYMISNLYKALPPMSTIIDGIYSLERGPLPFGKALRTDVIIASADIVSADMVGAKILGHDPAKIPSLIYAAKSEGRPVDMSDIEILGEKIANFAKFHKWDFSYNALNSLSMEHEKMGVSGLSYPKYDDTMCSYCCSIYGLLHTAITFAWKGVPWDNVEILTGKKMKSSGGKNKTVLLGQCMYNLNKDDPNIRELIAVKGCPPDPVSVGEAFRKIGIAVEPEIFKNIEAWLGSLMLKYKNKPEFVESFYNIV